MKIRWMINSGWMDREQMGGWRMKSSDGWVVG